MKELFLCRDVIGIFLSDMGPSEQTRHTKYLGTVIAEPVRGIGTNVPILNTLKINDLLEDRVGDVYAIKSIIMDPLYENRFVNIDDLGHV